MTRKILCLVSLALVVGYLGCGPKPGIRPESALDTPEAAYERGHALLERGEYAAALHEFQRSIELARYQERPFAPGHEGLALAYLGEGDLELAWQEATQALETDSDYAPAYIARGRIRYAQGEYKKAVKEYKRALGRDEQNPIAYYYMGKAYERLEEFDKAREAYLQALELDPGYAEADRALEELGRLGRAVAGMPPEYQEIAHSPAITRADVAALLYNELPLERIARKSLAPEPGRPLSDIEGHWAAFYIQAVVDLGLMDPYPDGTFGPDDPITRGGFALVLERVLVLATGDPSLATRFIGSPSPFPDVPPTNPLFNAVMTATSRGWMSVQPDGTFGLTDPVPGRDALLAIKKFMGQL